MKRGGGGGGGQEKPITILYLSLGALICAFTQGGQKILHLKWHY